MIDTTPLRRRVIDATDDEINNLAREIRDALEGDSNDAERDALAYVAGFLGVEYGDPADEEG